MIEDIYADDRIPHDAYRPTFVKSLAMVPIRTLDPVGAIGNYWAERHQPTERGGRAAAGAGRLDRGGDGERPTSTSELEEERLETLQRLARVAEYRDDATYEHTERVAGTARRLGEQLGLPAAEIELICQAAPAARHRQARRPRLDPAQAGKADAPRSSSRSRGTPEPAPRSSPAALGGPAASPQEIALTHHEWWDGSGYPGGLQWRARSRSAGGIVALADVFDALTHERPYKKAWPLAKAQRRSGT